MNYKVIDKETWKAYDFYDEGSPTFFKSASHAKSCIESHELIDYKGKVITDPYLFVAIVENPWNLKVLRYFLKRNFQTFLFNIRYNKSYYLRLIWQKVKKRKIKIFGFKNKTYICNQN